MSAWSASFVSPPDFLVGADDNPAAYLRGEFTVQSVHRAVLHVTALGLVDPWINGVRAGDEVLAPGWNPYDLRLAVSTYDITDLVHEGVNHLGAVLTEGWAVGRVGWEGRRAVWADVPAVFMQVDIDDERGRWSVGTDHTWRSGQGGVRANGLFAGEHFDARMEPPAWCTRNDGSQEWPHATVTERDLSVLVPRTWEPIRAVEEVPAKRILTTPGGRTVVDFGQNLVGWVRIRVCGANGSTVTLRHSETLIHGEIDFETNRGAEATDRYVLAGHAAGEVWEPRSTFHGFRFVDVEGWPGDLDLESLTAVVVHSDMRRTGWFETSHPGLSQLHRNVVWSMRGNFIGVPTDCPQRDERAGWTGDINAFASTAAYLYDARGVLGSWLTDLALEQDRWGTVPLVVPQVRDDAYRASARPTALWGDVAVNLPWLLYQEYGDEAVLLRQYASMTAYVEQVEALLDDRGLWSEGFQFGDWLAPSPLEKHGAVAADSYLLATAFFVRSADQVSRAASVLGRADDAKRFQALRDRVRSAFRAEWLTTTGRLANPSQAAYAVAICFDILDEDQLRIAGQHLADLVTAADFTIATGFAGTPWVAHALTRAGQLPTAYRLVLNEECPSFLYPLSMGATTIWERWDSIRPDGSLNSTGMTSLNHYALGAIADWLHHVVGGLSAAEPGYSALRIEPRPGGGIRDARTMKDTPHGRVEVAWHDANGIRTVEVVVPDGVRAEVILPQHPASLVERVIGGSHRWEYPPVPLEDDFPNMSTPLPVLQRQPIWPAVRAALDRHIPQLAALDEGYDLSSFGRTLRILMDASGRAGSALDTELEAMLAAGRKPGSPPGGGPVVTGEGSL